MEITQSTWTEEAGWQGDPLTDLPGAQLVLAFGGTSLLKTASLIQDLRKVYPAAELLGCSTAGEICDVQVSDDSLVVTAIQFDRTSVVSKKVAIDGEQGSVAAGQQLARALDPEDLSHVFVLSDGLSVNGSDLVAGLTAELPDGVKVTGGLSGDGDRFQETLVLSGAGAEQDVVAVVGLYGDSIDVSCASLGGWDMFGPERLITRSEGSVLYELDGQSALGLYKDYLGEHADGLPATGLLFPLALRGDDGETPVVRTILAVDEEHQSLTFAGDVPEGSYVRLMKANFDRLVDGAAGAAKSCQDGVAQDGASPDLAILISCVGRKMILKQRVEEEVEAVREVLGLTTALTGFYSYGEISPFTPDAKCELHNQTMTITTITER